jgi:hypothetical protein
MIQNVADVSGNDFNAYLVGYSSTTTAPGKIGQALTFNGSANRYVQLPTSVTRLSSTYTISVWINPTTISSEQYITSDWDVPGRNYLLRINSSGYLSLLVGDGSTNQDSELTSANLLATNQWQHVVAVINGTSHLLYVNGVLVGSAVGSYSGGVDSSTRRIGADFTGGSVFNGSIDDLRMYSRALSANEITRLYQIGATTKVNTTVRKTGTLENGLVGYWTFDGKDMIQNVADVSGTGNTGKIINQTSTTTAPGKIGQALLFDGVDDYVQTTSGELKTADNFTVSIWFKANSLSAGHMVWQGMAVANGWGNGAGAHQEMHFSMGGCCVGAGNFLNFYLGNIDNLTSVLSIDVPFSDTVNWHHAVAVVRDLSTAPSVEVYFDGVSQGVDSTATLAGTTRTSWDTNLRMGRPGDVIRYFSGYLDDVRVYTRILSANEITRLYQIGATTKVNTTVRKTGTLENGLLAYWSFDGKTMFNNVSDVSGQGVHGYLLGQSATSSAPGRIGQGLFFDGVDDRVIADTSLIPAIGSFSTWIKPATTNTSGQADGVSYIFSMADFTDSSRFYIIQSGSGIQIRLGGSAQTSTLYTIEANAWYHLVLTWGSGNYTLYMNGLNVAQGSYTGLTLNCAVNTIGAYRDQGCGNTNLKDFFNGVIDDTRIYNRVISDAEVKRLYQLAR